MRIHAFSPTKLGVCAILLVPVFGCAANAEEYLKSYPVSGTPSVRVNADNGGVHITTSDTNKVEFDVKYEQSDWGTDGGPKISSRQQGNTVELSAFVGDQGWWFHSGTRRLSIEVRMPKNADLHVETSNGGVDVSSVNGSVVVHTSNGGIRGEQLTGTIEVNSSNGGLTLEGLKGNVKAGTTNGAIRASGLDCRCGFSTTNGSVSVAGRFDSLDISSGNGAVVARADSGSRMSSAWNIQTTNAAVNLSLPADIKANVNAGTTNGRIVVDLPHESRGDSSRTEVHTALNGGGPDLSVRTTNGSIHLSGI